MCAQRVKLTSEMQYIQGALRDERATLQKFSMKELRKPDPSFQPRVVHLNMDHVKNLGDILQNLLKLGHDLEPGVIFRDSKANWKALVDGFHRHEAYRLAKLPYFPAYVIEGTKDEAIEYAAMANQHAMLTRTREDVRKQVEMLLGIPRWFRLTVTEIANHVGCAPSTVSKYRSAYCDARGLDIPPILVVNSSGLEYVKRRRKAANLPVVQEEVFRTKNAKERVRFTAKVDGKTVYLARSTLDGPDRDRKRSRAEEKLKGVVLATEDRKGGRKQILTRDRLVVWLHGRGVVVERDGLHRSKYPGISCLRCRGFLIDVCDSMADGIHGVVGSLLLFRQLVAPGDGGARLVVVCCPEEGPPEIMGLASQIGIEFLTPEELVASIKGDDDQSTPIAKGGK